MPGQEAGFNVSAMALDCAHKKVKKGYHAADSSVTLYYSAPNQAVSHTPHSSRHTYLSDALPNTPLRFASPSFPTTLKSLREINGFGRRHSTNMGGDAAGPKDPVAFDPDAASKLVAKPGAHFGAAEGRI